MTIQTAMQLLPLKSDSTTVKVWCSLFQYISHSSWI